MKKKKKTRVDWRAAFMYLARANFIVQRKASDQEFLRIVDRYRKEFRTGGKK
jgi:hypothetical protein